MCRETHTRIAGHRFSIHPHSEFAVPSTDTVGLDHHLKTIPAAGRQLILPLDQVHDQSVAVPAFLLRMIAVQPRMAVKGNIELAGKLVHTGGDLSGPSLFSSVRPHIDSGHLILCEIVSILPFSVPADIGNIGLLDDLHDFAGLVRSRLMLDFQGAAPDIEMTGLAGPVLSVAAALLGSRLLLFVKAQEDQDIGMLFHAPIQRIESGQGLFDRSGP